VEGEIEMSFRTLVITPLQSEFVFLSQAISELGFYSLSEKIGSVDVLTFPKLELTLARGGHGKTEYAIHTMYLVDRTSLDLVICAGAAGSLSPSISIGDIIAATSTVEHDYHEKFSERPKPQFFGDEQSIEQLRSIRLKEKLFKLHFGIIASGDEDFIEHQRAEELHRLYGAIAVAWEGAGGARACAFNKKPYLELRGITDSADQSAASNFEENLELAMQNIATVLVEACHGTPERPVSTELG
jgi:adenosylhomocysteine nucleosidase